MNTITKHLDALFQPWNRSDAPGLVVGIAHKGQTIYRRGFGLSSIEHGTANTPQTKMRIGSTSKHFAALAVLLLAEDGKLDIDAPLRSYLPELPDAVGTPTLRQLMQHSGGLRDPYDLPIILLDGCFPATVPAGPNLELSLRFTSANFAPGERMIYCNSGYHLLSLMVERLSGLSLGEFLQQRVLAPLGMHDTSMLTTDMTMLPGIASFHMPQADGSYRRGIYPVEELLGSGGMVSTIDDMLRWLAHLRGTKTVGSADSWAQMLEQPRHSSGAVGDYCLGLTREVYRGVDLIHHAGAVLGCNCQMLTVPAHELDIIVIFNRMDSNPSALALKIVDTALAELALPPAVAAVPAAGNEAFIGHWYAPDSHCLLGIVAQAVDAQPAVLALSIHNKIVGTLKPSASGWSMNTPSHGTLDLQLPAEPASKRLDFSDSGHRESFLRLPSPGPAAADLAVEIVGSYRYADFDRELAVVLDAGVLYLDLCPRYGQSRFRIEPLSSEVCGLELTGTFPIPVPTPGSLSIARRDGRVTGLWLNTLRTRNLWLERCASRSA